VLRVKGKGQDDRQEEEGSKKRGRIGDMNGRNLGIHTFWMKDMPLQIQFSTQHLLNIHIYEKTHTRTIE